MINLTLIIRVLICTIAVAKRFPVIHFLKITQMNFFEDFLNVY